MDTSSIDSSSVTPNKDVQIPALSCVLCICCAYVCSTDLLVHHFVTQQLPAYEGSISTAKWHWSMIH